MMCFNCWEVLEIEMCYNLIFFINLSDCNEILFFVKEFLFGKVY